ncbi:MAG: RIO1 family regulatory kinase/ATPase [Candidatus Paceibacterota bacterium]
MSSSFSLQVLAIHKDFLKFNLIDDCKNFIGRCGYEIILEKSDDNFNQFKQFNFEKKYESWYLVLDLLPWRSEKKRLKDIKWANPINYRNDWAIFTIIRFIKEGYNFKFLTNRNEDYLKFFGDSVSILLILKKKYPTIYNSIKQKQLNFSSPFKVIRSLYDFGCNNKTELVYYDNNSAICKIFKPDKLEYLKNEVRAREILKDKVNIPKILFKKKNYLVIEYIRDNNSFERLLNGYKLIKIKYVKQIFSDLKKMYKAGLINFDFHTGNIIVTNNFEIYYIDFEYIEFHNNLYTFTNNPAFKSHRKIDHNSPLEHITYEKYWYPYILLSLWSLVKLPIHLLYILRIQTIIRIYIKKYANKIFRKLRGEFLKIC